MDNKEKSIEQMERECAQKHEEVKKALREPRDIIKATIYATEIESLQQKIMKRKHNRT
jgi:hypothetical protein